MSDSHSPVIHHPAESQLFDDTLSCETALPAEFRLGTTIVRPGVAETLLRSVALVEDNRGADDGDERGESSLQVQRLEAKLDLMMVLLGRMVRQHSEELPLRPLRWSRQGLRLDLGARTGAAVGAAGIVRMQPSEWLPDHVDLPVSVLAEAANGNGGHHLWLRFRDLGDSLEMALERHLFRLHRRQVAEARRPR